MLLRFHRLQTSEMVLSFPGYLNKKAEVIKGTGNAVIPEGTRVT